MHHLSPLARHQSLLTVHISAGKIAVHTNVRRTAELHHHLALSLFIPPADQRGVHPFGANPQLCAVILCPHRQCGNLFPAGHSASLVKMTRCPNHSSHTCCPCVTAADCSGVITHRIMHVPDTAISVGFVENSGSVRFALRCRVAPVHPQLLPRGPPDLRNVYPDTGRTGFGIPVFDLIPE